jgi:hypothetical protein
MTDFHCPSCEKPFDISDMPWACPKCGHLDEHWNPMLNCGNCGFNPDDTTDMHCPLCRAPINIMRTMFQKAPSPTPRSHSASGVYAIKDFLISDNVLISPEIQNAPTYPFTMECARSFFEKFINESFTLNGQVGSMVIHSAKENLPNHSFASGFLFLETLDELERRGEFPDPVGSIHMEYGGNTDSPFVDVKKL